MAGLFSFQEGLDSRLTRYERRAHTIMTPPAIPPMNAPDDEFEALLRICEALGRRMGHGTTRDVYELPGHPDKVLKVCHGKSNGPNWIEAMVYHHAGKYKDDLAEIHSFSLSGKYLVMERLRTGVKADDLNAVRPSFPPFFNDRKPSNYGWDANGKLKMLDYALFTLDTGTRSLFE
jgi:hypothetical protein